MSDDLQARLDALVAAAREVTGRAATYRAGPISPWFRDAIENLDHVVDHVVPRPLRRDDMVEQADADRVPAGAILRDAEGDVWRVTLRHWFCAGFASAFAPSEIDPDAWPMQVVDLPEGADQ